ncbi:cyclase family protein [Streptomyces sp. NPDC008222]|uniref:cyclase family protein n=1 Tax=Streptomyces sp. NPDC008222 TaxID=3364820 RepID=UPI0036E0BC95
MTDPLALSPDDFEALYRRLRGAAGAAPTPRGALDRITPELVRRAVGEVRTGRTVSMAAPVETRQEPDCPDPARHWLTAPVPPESPADGLHFARDRLAMNMHSNVDSHLDALCHVIWEGTLYGGTPPSSLTPSGATALSVDLARDGIVGRGVLLDIPALHGVPWLEPGAQVTTEDLVAAEAAQNVRVEPGDLLFVRVGHRRRRRAMGPWDAARERAGLHPAAMEFLAEREVAVLGCDSNSDAAPGAIPGVAFPIHVLAVHAMGIHLLDYLQFEDLTPLCAGRGHWSFLCVIAPLRIPGATGSPVNPIAVL